MQDRINELLNEFIPDPSFFIGCGVVRKIWNHFFPNKFSVTYELFK